MWVLCESNPGSLQDQLSLINTEQLFQSPKVVFKESISRAFIFRFYYYYYLHF